MTKTSTSYERASPMRVMSCWSAMLNFLQRRKCQLAVAVLFLCKICDKRFTSRFFVIHEQTHNNLQMFRPSWVLSENMTFVYQWWHAISLEILWSVRRWNSWKSITLEWKFIYLFCYVFKFVIIPSTTSVWLHLVSLLVISSTSESRREQFSLFGI